MLPSRFSIFVRRLVMYKVKIRPHFPFLVFPCASWPVRSARNIPTCRTGRPAAICRAPMFSCRLPKRSASRLMSCWARRVPNVCFLRAEKCAGFLKPLRSCRAASRKKFSRSSSLSSLNTPTAATAEADFSFPSRSINAARDELRCVECRLVKKLFFFFSSSGLAFVCGGLSERKRARAQPER